MSVPEREREEDRRKTTGRSAGLGLAAAAVGVGVGAALYYFLSKRPEENRESGASSSENLFRQRTWTLEECSICFDVMLKEQEVLALPCTHRFHVACIGPWLEAQQTCPNCRNAAE